LPEASETNSAFDRNALLDAFDRIGRAAAAASATSEKQIMNRERAADAPKYSR
jgi:hypothetical protein